MGVNTALNFHESIRKDSVSVQEMLRCFSCDEMVDQVMQSYVEAASSKSLSFERKENVRMCLREDVRDILNASPMPLSRFLAISPNDVSALREVTWEEALCLPVVGLENCSKLDLQQLAETIIWEMLEGKKWW